MKRTNLLEFSRFVTGDSNLGFDNVHNGLIIHSKRLGFDIEFPDSFEKVLSVPAENYENSSLDFDSSGFKGAALKNLPRVISGPEYTLFSAKGGFVTFVQNHPFVFTSCGHPSNFGSRYTFLFFEEKFRFSYLDPFTENTLNVSGKALLLSDDCWSPPNYCHWLFDWFTRLAFVADISGRNESVSVLMPAAAVAPWVLDSINIFRIFNPNFNFIFLPSNVTVKADELLVPSSCGAPIPHPANKFATWAINFILDKVKCSDSLYRPSLVSTDQFPKRIFIDRSASTRGSGLVLDKDFDVFLKDYGIQKIFLEDFRILDQKYIFENCELIVGLHGAGFTNLIFSQPGSKVVEIFSPEFGSPAYAMLSGKIGLRYSAICGDLRDDDLGLDKAWRKVTVSTSSLVQHITGGGD